MLKMEKTIAQFEKNSREEVMVKLTEFKGRQYVDVRAYYREKEGDEFKRSRKGITVSPQQLDPLVEALAEAKRVLDEAGLLKGE